MPLLSRLLGIWALGKTVRSTTPLFMRLIVGMAVVTLFAVFAAVLLAMVIGAIAWLGYNQLLVHGVSEGIAMSVVVLILFAALLIMVLVLQHHCRKASDLAKQIMYMQAPVSGRLSMLMESFMSGYERK